MAKIKLLKALPWAEVGEIHNSNEFGADYLPYDLCFLIESWWAEEVKEDTLWIPKVGEIFYQPSVEYFWVEQDVRGIHMDDKKTKIVAELWLIFKTEQGAKKRLLFLELTNSNGGFVPKEWEKYFAFMPDSIDGILSDVCELTSTGIKITNWIALWNCYRTRSQAEKYAPKWKEYFDLLTK